MSASMVRSACRIGRSFLQIKHSRAIARHQRCCSNIRKQYNDETVPYFPEKSFNASLEAKYPEVEVSSEDFKFVERLLPDKTVPPPPEHKEYPTPSGWIPPNPSIQPSEYSVSRSRNHMLPVYLEEFFSGRICTHVLHINGDIWKFNEDVLKYINENVEVKGTVDSQVHEVGHFVRFKGNHVSTVVEFLLKQGF